MSMVATARASWREGDEMGKRRSKNKGNKPKKEKAPETVAHCTDAVRTMRQPHRRPLPQALRGDERAESPFGRLAVRGVIDGDQYEAGNIFAGAVGAFAATIGTPRSVSGTLGSLTVSDYPDDMEDVDNELDQGCAAEISLGGAKFCLKNPLKCECLARRQRYMKAYEYLLDNAGRRAVLVISRVVVHRQAIAQEDLVYLTRGLDALAVHFGLIAPRKHAD